LKCSAAVVGSKNEFTTLIRAHRFAAAHSMPAFLARKPQRPQWVDCRH
jgi:hypothetical protein